MGALADSITFTLSGVEGAEAEARLRDVQINTYRWAKRQADFFTRDIPEATGDLIDSFYIDVHAQRIPPVIELGFRADHAIYVMETGRQPGKRPRWEWIKRWAKARGVDEDIAWRWYWGKSAGAKTYTSPRGRSLQGWWSRTVQQFKQIVKRELRYQLKQAGFTGVRFT